jgi:hypothetical protein
LGRQTKTSPDLGLLQPGRFDALLPIANGRGTSALQGYAAWADPQGRRQGVAQRLARSCGCASACGIHGHDHAAAWSAKLPVSDLKNFWGALGCACWAV